MARKLQKHRRNVDPDQFDDFDDIYDENFDLDDLSRDIYSTEWGNDSEETERKSHRRKGGRRGELRRPHYELEDWEEFGEDDNWQTY